MNPHYHGQAIYWDAVRWARDIQIQTSELVELITVLSRQFFLRDRMTNSYLWKWTQWPTTEFSSELVFKLQYNTRILSHRTCRLAMLLRVLPVEIWLQLSHREFHDTAQHLRIQQAIDLAQIRVQELDDSC